MKKRSVTIAGHQTSLTLEDAFWVELKRIAKERDQSFNELVTEIDQSRDLSINMSSALRLFVLEQLKRTKE
jgi:predicted DNA-binding ribbon-helix-helix protein